MRFQVWWTNWPCLPSPTVSSLKVISGAMTDMGWATIMQEPHVLLNIQRDSIKQQAKCPLKQYVWAYNAVQNSTIPNVKLELVLVSVVNCTMCFFFFTPNMPGMEFSMSFLVKPASSVKNTWLIKKGSSHCQKNHWQNCWCGWKADLEPLPIANGTGIAPIHGEPTAWLMGSEL
jgi:hypothetical protein